MLQDYLPILLQVIVAIGFAAVALLVSVLIGRVGKRNPIKDSAYECGMLPIGEAQPRFSVKFYLVAMLFILFDIEAIFLYPWAVVYKQLKMFGFFEMLTFVVLILAGFFYIWQKGVLDWARNEEPEPAMSVRMNLTPLEPVAEELVRR